MPNVDDCMRALREVSVPQGPGEALNADTVRALQQRERMAIRRPRRMHPTRWAAAAAIAVVAVGSYLMRGSVGLEQVALADATQRALATQSVMFRFREHWGTARAMVKADDGMRIERDNGDVTIIDRRTRRALVLDARKHSARIEPAQAWTRFDIYSWLRDLPSDTSHCVGEDLIDQQTAVGFRVIAPIPASNGLESAEFTVWVDTQTGLPIRIDAAETTDDEHEWHTFAWDLRFDVPLDDGLFEFSVPEGYTLQPSTADADNLLTDDGAPEGAGDGTSAMSASGQPLRTVPVGRPVSEFTDEEDFATPQAAYANINRARVAGTNDAWARVSAHSLRPVFPLSDEPAYAVTPEVAAMWLNAEIVEVLYCGDKKAAVVARWTRSSGEHRFDLRSLTLEDGRWLNLGGSVFPTAEQAREKFARFCR